MLAFELHNRLIESKDWATILFVLCLGIIAINKTISSIRFNEFIRLAFSDKYTKIYKDSSNLLSGFTISMFVLQMVSFTFFIMLILNQFGKAEKTNGIVFIQIFTFITVFILSKFLIEKIVATVFKIEEFNEQFNLLKVNYRAYFGFILLPLNIILFYNSFDSNLFFWILMVALLAINLVTYIIALKLYQNLCINYKKLIYICIIINHQH